MSSDKDNIGIMPSIRKSTVVEYNPDKFWKENTKKSIFEDLHKMQQEEEKRKKEIGWKHQYFISVGEAKTANLGHLKWLCENYSVIGGAEACKIIRQRQIIVPPPIK